MTATDPDNRSGGIAVGRQDSSSTSDSSVHGVPPSSPDDPGGTIDFSQQPENKGTVNATDDPTVIQRAGAAAGQAGKSDDGDPDATSIFAQAVSHAVHMPVEQDVGPYEIIGELGRGGMGVVYRARHKQLRREVALKMILRAAGTDNEVLERFRLEAQSVATLEHPGIVQIHEYGEHQGVPWFSLEFVAGQTLAQITAKEPLEPRRAARIVADLAAAVAYAHGRGVLHRDIKPANVLIAAGDTPKLTDFGIAKRVADDVEATDLKTVDGQIMGTPSYMPPEQARGMTAVIGPHSDQYALGATLYHLLTGRPPFVGSRALDVVLQVIDRDPLSVRQLQPSVPLDLETICLKAMAKEPARRYPNCAALEADLRRFLKNEPIVARPISGMERSIRWCRRNPRIAIPVTTAIIAVLAALSISLWSSYALAQKNKDIEKEKNAAVQAEEEADKNARQAEKNAIQAQQNEKLAYDRAVDAKNSVAEILFEIRKLVPATEEKLRPVREELLRLLSNQLDRLPDLASDDKLNTGLEKARLLQERYLTSLELGEPTKAVAFLDEAETILRARNAAQKTDVTRLNLTSVLYYKAWARMAAKRDMELVCRLCRESAQILDEILSAPNPSRDHFDKDRGSVPEIDTITKILIEAYQYAITLKHLGRVHEGLEVIDRAFGHFDNVLVVLRKTEQFRHLSELEWESIKPQFRGMLADQEQVRATLLASVGRREEAAASQAQIIELARQRLTTDQSEGRIESKSKLSLTLVFAGDLARQRGQMPEAVAYYEEAANITGALYNDNPALEDRRNRHHVSLMRLAGLLKSSDLPRARQSYAEAQEIAREMIQADDKAINKQIALALVSPFGGPPEKAVALAEQILARMEIPDAEMDIDLARVFAASAEAIMLAEPDNKSAEEWKKRSMELVNQAVSRDYRDEVYLAGEPDLASIRSLPSFIEVLSRCAAENRSKVASPANSATTSEISK